MVNYPNYLSGTQDDINKRLLNMILELQKENAGDASAIDDVADDVKDIQDAIGTETKSGTILYRIKALETANAGSGGSGTG